MPQHHDIRCDVTNAALLLLYVTMGICRLFHRIDTAKEGTRIEGRSHCKGLQDTDYCVCSRPVFIVFMTTSACLEKELHL
jgi:hypothetical protein